ncbi:C45 family peptidase [Dyadobacter tibetensis]|uniref:C45 family peptidase n=1 Tax=Dyadobacter tibetensis TaxID=1211851 RepID=UPI001E60C64A|nr:C45 family peptidase [Dyadobacter tibetensis]
MAWFIWMIRIPEPEIKSTKNLDSYQREQIGPFHYKVGNCWLKRNDRGVWEMYLEGSPYERGLIYGILSKELMEKQEQAFVDQINELIPNTAFLQILKGFVGWFNRDIDEYIPEENLQEIFGVSQSFSSQYDYIGPKFYRILNYHAAHDIGHALTDLNMVGCTSFSVNGLRSIDSTLLIGRNFDFYMGDAFAEDKLIVFVKPDQGHAFASYAWAGLTGVVSGMNVKGLTVTLNAAKSDIPYAAKAPISLLAREILQYASNIDEAMEIAQRRQTFVSESLLIGSASDNRSVIIEKSPKKMGLYQPSTSTLVCANHYQSDTFQRDSVNIRNMQDSDSGYRHARMQELLEQAYPLNVSKAASILRNKKGIGDESIGLGNPKAINQLIAHHAIIFKPAKRLLWISAAPYQLGAFLAYDLAKVFDSGGTVMQTDSLRIPADPFIRTQSFRDYEHFKQTRHSINRFANMGIPFELSANALSRFVSQNPKSYLTYLALGDYFYAKKEFEKALAFYNQSLEYPTASRNETAQIQSKIAACQDRL